MEKNHWKNRRVFVSGGAGVIGTSLVNALLENGAVVFVGDLKPEPAAWKGRLQYRQGDLISLSQKEMDQFAPETYIHLAAAFERSHEEYGFWADNFHHNVYLSHHLMTLCKDLPSLKSVVFASSYLIYDPQLYLFTEPRPCISLKEESLVNPRNLCGMAKLMHEKELQFIQENRPELQVISARIYRSYGRNSRDIISRWIHSTLKKEPLTVFCEEGQFDYVFADDIAKTLLELECISFSGVVNVATGHSRTVKQVVECIKSNLGGVKVVYKDVKMPVEASQADIGLLTSLIPGCRFQTIEEVIPQLIDFYRSR